MKKIKNTLITCSAIAIFATGCGPSKEAIEAKAQYDLAERNVDLESMYLAASKLVSYEFETETYKRKLIGINQGIDLTKEMESSAGDHDHESAMFFSDLLLDEFPDYPKAKKRFRESGLIVQYMMQAQSHLESNWNREKKEFVQTENEKSEKETDFIKISGAMNKASELINKAKELDKIFVDNIKIEESINAYKNNHVFMTVSIWGPSALREYPKSFDLSIKTYNAVLGLMREYNVGYATTVKGYDESINACLKTMNKVNDMLIEQLNGIKLLETKENAPLIKWFENTIDTTCSKTDIFTQTSSQSSWAKAINEGRNAHTKAQAEFKKLNPLFKESSKYYKKVLELMIKIDFLNEPDQTIKLLSKRKDLLSA